MTWVLAVLAGIVGAVVGWFVTGAAAALIAGWFGMSDFEGGRGMFAFLGVGPIGGLLGMVVSIWAVLRRRSATASLGRSAARIGVVVGAIAALVGAGIWLRLATMDTYSGEAPPMLEFEIRVPVAMALPERSAVEVELHTDKNVGQSWFADPWLRAEGGHQVIAGGVPLDFKTSSRLLVVSLRGQPTRLFRLELSRDPASTAALGSWVRPDHVDHPDQAQPVAAPPDDPVGLRYRVRRAGEE
jgi:hypothetical protein